VNKLEDIAIHSIAPDQYKGLVFHENTQKILLLLDVDFFRDIYVFQK